MTQTGRQWKGFFAVAWLTVGLAVQATGQDELRRWRRDETRRTEPKEPRFVDFARRNGFYTERIDETSDGDITEALVAGGVVLRANASIEIRAERGVILFDRDERTAYLESLRDRSGLPRRGFEPPPTRRAITPDVLRARLNRFVGSLERKPNATPVPPDIELEVVRGFYLEGGVTFIHDNRQVVHADRVWVSVIEDRAVFENVELRLYHDSARGEQVVVLRSDELTREGPRFHGRDVSVTTCDAGEPHFEILSGETEIIERGDEFEIKTRDNWFAFTGRHTVPLPDAKHYTGDPANYYIKSVKAGYSSDDGVILGVDFGAPMHDVGGAVHEFLTGRPADEFRGEWRLGTGWIQDRGVPFDGELNYRAEDVYFGKTRFYHLDDRGTDRREIRLNVDDTLIDEDRRELFLTENRVFLNADTTLDATAFWAGDPAVYSEFFAAPYLTAERPESTLHFRHAARNYSLQVLGRWNAADFSYSSGRALEPRFVEAEPRASFDLISHELAELPGDAPLLLTSASQVARFGSDYDKLFQSPIDDDTTRLDQELELAVPFRSGGVGFRVFTGGRITHFSDTVAGTSRERWAFTAGMSMGTRLERTWRWLEGETRHALRHVVSPTVAFEHRFKVDGDPGEFHQFDELDALDEGANVRVGVLQRFQRRTKAAGESAASDVEEFLWIDLAQNFTPISSRDNAGHHVGLGEFEFIIRPNSPWLPLDNFALTVEGEHDWDESELRTFNTYSTFGAVGMNWFTGYRADRTERGVFQYGSSLPVRGRWSVGWGSSYDFARKEALSYTGVLIRQDHDWRIILSLTHDNIVDESQVRIDFEPDFGGLFRQRQYDDLFGGFRDRAY